MTRINGNRIPIPTDMPKTPAKKGVLKSILSYIFSPSKSKVDTSWMESSKKLYADDKKQLLFSSILKGDHQNIEVIKKRIEDIPFSQLKDLQNIRLEAERKSINPIIIENLKKREAFLNGLYGSHGHKEAICSKLGHTFKQPRVRRADKRLNEIFRSFKKGILKLKVKHRFKADTPGNRKIRALLESYLKVQDRINTLGYLKKYTPRKLDLKGEKEWSELQTITGKTLLSEELKREFTLEDLDNLNYLLKHLPKEEHYPALKLLKEALENLIGELK